MTLADMHVKCLLILMDLLGPDIFAEVTNERTSFASCARIRVDHKFEIFESIYNGNWTELNAIYNGNRTEWSPIC